MSVLPSCHHLDPGPPAAADTERGWRAVAALSRLQRGETLCPVWLAGMGEAQ